MLRRFALEGACSATTPTPRARAPRSAARSCWSAKASTSTSSLLPDGEDPDTFVQKRGREAFVGQLKTSRPYLEFLLDRAAAEHDLTRDEQRREFLRKMLAVAARIPDPAARDQFADRLAHKARVTEEVVRAEIRKAAAARKTELPAERRPDACSGHVRPAESGLLWGLVHHPSGRDALDSTRWKMTDLEGLSSSDLLEMARELDAGDPSEAPSA